VFVVQDSPGKNFLAARDFGDITVVLERDAQVTFAAAPTVRKLWTALHKYCDADWIIAVGDPVAIGIACAIAAEVNEGRFNLLKWDRQETTYYPVRVQLKEAPAPYLRKES
jgi:hypothetical protein